MMEEMMGEYPMGGGDEDPMYKEEKKKQIMELMSKIFEMIDAPEEMAPEALEGAPLNESELMAEDSMEDEVGDQMDYPDEAEAMSGEGDELRDEIKEYMRNGTNGSKGDASKSISVMMSSAAPSAKKVKKKKGK